MNIQKTVLHMLILAVLAFGARAQEADAPTLEDGTQLVLAGAGVYENLGERIYVGGLYLPLLDVTIEPGQSRRLEMRIAAESLSARRFARFWADAITLNSAREERLALAPQITAFGDLLQSNNLLRGDHVSFDLLGSGATIVRLNGVELGRVAGARFQDMLLSAWIGPTPPSARLKQGLLGQLSAHDTEEVRQEFAAIHFTPARFAEIDAQYNEERRRALEEQEREQEAALAAEQERAAEQARQEELARAQEEQARIAELAAAEAERLRREEERARHAAEQAQLAESYRGDLIAWLVRHVSYPSYSLQKGHEGRVEIRIVSGRGGDVIEHVITESSGNELLDRATMDMVRKAAPLPAMPAALEGESFAFVMPVNFSLED